MLCNWVFDYSPATVLATPGDPSSSLAGALIVATSDWDDDFQLYAWPAREWTPELPAIDVGMRALDGGVVPGYFLDLVPDLAGFAANGQSGSAHYQNDLAPRTGNQTARELWIAENS